MSGPTPEELQAAGLYDPDDELAAERLELLEYLVGLGATIDEMAQARDELPALASQRALRGPGARLTHAEAATRAGLSEEAFARIWRAAGFPHPGPDARAFTDEDVEMIAIFQAGAALLGEDTVLQVLRVIGSSMARIADATVGAFVVNVAAPKIADDPSGLSLARANAEAVTLLRQAAGAMDVIFRHYVELLQRPLDLGDQRTQQLAVGFTDLVGSTALAQGLSIRELGQTLAEFDELASDVVVTNGGRVVKLIGDEVMYVAADPRDVCAIARTLSERLAGHPRLPPARTAVAFGAVLSRDGDYFGPVVNLAARMVKLAEPGTVLVSAELGQVIGSDRMHSIGARVLKGFDRPVELFLLDE